MRRRGRLHAALVGFGATTLLFAGSATATWTVRSVAGGGAKAGYCDPITVVETETVYVANEATTETVVETVTVEETVPAETVETVTTEEAETTPLPEPETAPEATPTDEVSTSPDEPVTTTDEGASE